MGKCGFLREHMTEYSSLGPLCDSRGHGTGSPNERMQGEE